MSGELRQYFPQYLSRIRRDVRSSVWVRFGNGLGAPRRPEKFCTRSIWINLNLLEQYGSTPEAMAIAARSPPLPEKRDYRKSGSPLATDERKPRSATYY